MTERPKKMILIGVDAAVPEIIELWIKKGKLPHLARLMEKGVFGKILPPFPPVTAPNWASIVTGNWMGTHGITGYFVHHAGDPLNKIRTGFDTRECNSEFLWDAAERVGMKSILMKYPVSWPPTIKEGIQVDGCGPNSCDEFHEISDENIFSVKIEPLATNIKLTPAKNWVDAPKSKSTPLEAKVSYYTYRGKGKVLRMLIIDSHGSGYDKVILSKSKELKENIGTLTVGEWSSWLFENFETADGVREGTVRFKLFSLEKDASELRLYATQIFPTQGFTYPDHIASELIKKIGPFVQRPGWPKIPLFDDEIFLEQIEYQNTWMAEASCHLMENYDWQLYFMQTHCCDYAQHRYLSKADPVTCCDPQSAKTAMTNLERVYKSVDNMTGKILTQADEDTLVVLVSDHGAKASIGQPPLLNILEKAGLLVFKEEPATRELRIATMGTFQIDWKKTKAYPRDAAYIYVNLRGRDPDGIVEPGREYEEVRERIIEALCDYKDPKTGHRVFSLVLRKEDTKVLGLYGDGVGDVVFALRVEYGHEHGQQLPPGNYGIGSISSVFMMSGPGVKKNYQMQSHRWLTDVAPTISYLLDIPVPKDTEGGVMYDALIDPDMSWKEKTDIRIERDKWKEAYEAMERITHI